MMSQISGPCCDSDIEPDHCFVSFVWKNHVRQQIFVIWEYFFCEKKQNPAWFSIIYILKIINVCQDIVNMEKNYTDEWFYFSCSVGTVGKILLQYFTKECMVSRASKLFIKWCIWLNS